MLINFYLNNRINNQNKIVVTSNSCAKPQLNQLARVFPHNYKSLFSKFSR